MSKERFKKIPNFNYFISDRGRVWSISHKKFLKPNIMRCGNAAVQLCRNGKVHGRSLTKLWRLAFNFPRHYIVPLKELVGHSRYAG